MEQIAGRALPDNPKNGPDQQPAAASFADLIDALGRNESAVKGLLQEVGALVQDVGKRRASMGK